MKNSILLHDLTHEQLGNLIDDKLVNRLKQLKKDLDNKSSNDDLLTRDEACAFLKIDSSTLWSWTNKGKIISYAIGARRYYKRNELIESLIPVKK
ncbi:helix-turn-helix domain-containing protein [Maribacter sp. SA7]|uniref:helix-turn-helix domain-containing protein n=1 Tax=Maribacter zhoushanensis TaxID=3030012 RepID=UPI0023EB81E3|nr:helix-turn-helix domain-containing protein [Maribacter zhoushanensis]MDF4204021.1 helix-turn-helix domain-containing protein [Maribacter zhoushanensis]